MLKLLCYCTIEKVVLIDKKSLKLESELSNTHLNEKAGISKGSVFSVLS